MKIFYVRYCWRVMAKVTRWTEKFYIYNQGLILAEAKEAVISDLPFESFALFWEKLII